MARVGATPPKELIAIELTALMATLAADTTVVGRCDHALIALLLGAGARLGTALALVVGDVDAARIVALRELKGGGSM